MRRARGTGETALTRNHDGRLPFPFQRLGWTRRDTVGFLVGGVAVIAIVVNVLFMQSGLHPAPMFKPPDAGYKGPAIPDQRPATPLRGAEPVATPLSRPAAPRMPGDIIMDIQRELSRRGYYDGVLDGLYGPKTDAAIREFERSFGLKPSLQPNEMLLQTIMRSPAKGSKSVTGGVTGTIPPPRPAGTRAGNSIEPSQRVVTLQRTLAEFGYGQIKPSGVVDADTQRAIEKFERGHKLPVTGQLSDQFVRELAAATGQSFE